MNETKEAIEVKYVVEGTVRGFVIERCLIDNEDGDVGFQFIVREVIITFCWWTHGGEKEGNDLE